ncbi:hypothetical protein CS542_09570 [Pedobacter sp. IW39]|nr:hypothetical protein CS542_09570 [Pedobacter sp. IW39]
MLSLAVMMLSVAIIKGLKQRYRKSKRICWRCQDFKLDLNNSFELTFCSYSKTLADLKENKDIAYFQSYATNQLSFLQMMK